MKIPKAFLKEINLDPSKALVKMSANYIFVVTCSLTTDLFLISFLIKWWLTGSYVFILWIRQRNRSKNNIINIKFNNHDTWFTPPQSKFFLKLSYHALEACFNLGLSHFSTHFYLCCRGCWNRRFYFTFFICFYRKRSCNGNFLQLIFYLLSKANNFILFRYSFEKFSFTCKVPWTTSKKIARISGNCL